MTSTPDDASSGQGSWWQPVTQDQFNQAIHQILAGQAAIVARLSLIDSHVTAVEKNVTNIGATMATQADIDALTAALAQEDSDLNTAVANLTAADTAIAAEIAALEAANPALDLSGLQTEFANSSSAAAAVAAAVTATAALVPPATS